MPRSNVPAKTRSRICGIDGDAHHAVHNVPLARLVFVPKDDGRLHRCAIDAIEAGHNVAGSGKEAEGVHGHSSVDDAAQEGAA